MLKIHFLNVGKGNCTIIEFPSGQNTIVDIDNSRIEENDRKLTEPIEYYENNIDSSVFRFILTHPDMDHMSGLNELDSKYTILNFWDTENEKEIIDWDDTPYDKRDWDKYQEFRKSETTPRYLRILRGEKRDCCYLIDGITILSPSTEMIKQSKDADEDDSDKYNHLSYVLMIEYSGLKILLGGDATTEVWDDIVKEYGGDILDAHIFLAPHHGSPHNVNKEAFSHIDPQYVIVSVAEGVDYDYDYYKELASSDVLSTKYYGTIRFELGSNGKYTKYLEKNG